MKNLSLKHIPFGLLVTYLVKSLILGAGLNDVLLIGILAGLTAFYEAKLSLKHVKDLEEQMKLIRDHNSIQDRAIDDLKSSIASVKISSGIRGMTSGPR